MLRRAVNLRRPAMVLSGLVLLNMGADLVPFYFKEAGGDPTVGVIGYIRAAALGLLAFYFWLKFGMQLWRRSAAAKLILVLLAYFGGLVLFTSDVPYASAVYLKVFFSTLVFVFARKAFRQPEDMVLLHKAVAAALAVIVVQFVFTQTFQLGLDNTYVAGSIYWGGATPEALSRTLTYGLLCAPAAMMMIGRPRTRLLMGLIYASSALVLVLLFNRTAMAATALGFTTVFFFERARKRLFLYLMAAVTVFVVVMPYVQLAFLDLAVARYNQTVDQLGDEARVAESLYVWEEFNTKGLRHSLLGTEMFNSPQYFFEAGYFPVKRQLHVDYNKILHGSGLVGLTLFIGLYVALGLDFRRAIRRIRRVPLTRTARATFVALCVTSLTLSIGSDIEYVGPRSILFLYLGAFIGMAEEASRRVEVAAPVARMTVGGPATRRLATPAALSPA